MPCPRFANGRRFHRIWQEFHSAFLRMSPLEPPEVPLLYPAMGKENSIHPEMSLSIKQAYKTYVRAVILLF